MKKLFSYLHYRRIIVVVLALWAVVFGIVFALYDLPEEPLLYAAVLAASFTVPILIADFRSFCLMHRTLSGLLTVIEEDITLLPEPKNLPMRDYDALLRLLAQAKNAAQSEKHRALAEMGEYYTLWAHQIKTPIAAMRLALEGLAATDENEELREQLFRIEQYVEMVLTYVRSEDAAGDYCIVRLGLDEVIRGAVRKYRRSFIRKHITLDLCPTNLTVLTDEKWLSFALEQLLSNALKYTPPYGTIRVYSPGDRLLAISDNGIGIAAEDLPRVCEKGFTGYNGRADKKSSGIGLYLVKRVLTRLSHSLDISSKVGVGTTVTVHFPDDSVQYD